MAVLNEEQKMIRDAAKAWVLQKSPVAAFRKLRDSNGADGFDHKVWKEMADMGWPGILIPEDFGGTDLGYLTLGLVLEETGRTLTASPLVATGLGGAAAILLGGSDAQRKKYLPPIAEGNLIATLAIDEESHHAPERVALKAEKSGAGFKLGGKKVLVMEGVSAELFIVAARTSGAAGDKSGVTLFLVPANAQGLARQSLNTIDNRGFANLILDGAELQEDDILGVKDQGFALLESILDRVRAGLSAEMLGLALQAFETTLAYLKTRVQFDQIIGSFQALQHRAAKILIEIELARSCVEAALQEADQKGSDLPQLASLAKAKAGELVHLVSNEMIQMHGGIGMTDEHDAGFYIKRARVLEALLGSAAYHRNRYATLLGY